MQELVGPLQASMPRVGGSMAALDSPAWRITRLLFKPLGLAEDSRSIQDRSTGQTDKSGQPCNLLLIL